jgi:predicted dehydrogenase
MKVLGCGSIGRQDVNSLRTLATHKVIACDLDPPPAAVVREEHGISEFLFLSEALQDSPDAAVILTHHGSDLERLGYGND